MTAGTSQNGLYYAALSFSGVQQRFLLHHNKRLYADPYNAQRLADVTSSGDAKGRVLVVDFGKCDLWQDGEDLQAQYEHAEEMIQYWAKRADEMRARLMNPTPPKTWSTQSQSPIEDIAEAMKALICKPP